ncbi:hypothetical protein BDV25DRAFT_153540 [Aspergillus avenaceus]|uniref:NACHT domain-containing protein n=1 Tax=Aspergillus avenaceus TaxID=36643 RepID=A0A5N6TXY2_ASPAV|nr:hypothetical protein BDV25DRAFT_153540 [Aspergillus avenaceus]
MVPPVRSKPRPRTVKELIQRIRDPGVHVREKEALNTLVECMIAEFRDNPQPSYHAEASQLTDITDGTQYEDLTRVFISLVIDSSAKGFVSDRDLLPAFERCLRHHRDRSSDHFLASPLANLHSGLRQAIEKADLQSQYCFLHILGTVLDVAVDIRLEGIHQDAVHQPLFNTLRSLEAHDDSRLAQAAAYAFEALRGIPDNEGPMDVFLRTSGSLVSATAKIAGSVATMDPGKALGAAPEVLELIGYIGKVLDSLETLGQTTEDLKNAFIQDIEQLPKQKTWYYVLRYTGPLIAAREKSFEVVEKALPELPCRNDWQFWCGLFDQLEQCWIHASEKRKYRIIEFTEYALSQESLQIVRSKNKYVNDWINLISSTFNCPQWKAQPHKPRRNPFSFFLRKRTEGTSLQQPIQHAESDDKTQQLLDTAWAKCHETHQFYMDAGIVQHYEANGLLEILRLSGKRLEMESCYVNLSLVEASMYRMNPEGFGTQPRDRLRKYGPNDGNDIQLQDLYKERTMKSGKLSIPKRILIRGRAGVGKTTLCKKIVHEFINGKLPSWECDRVLWIPLRKLKGQLNPEEFLYGNFFPNCADKGIFRRSLCDTMAAETKTLFILDGFDEIVGEVASNDNLKTLLNRQNVIITTRPYAVSPYTLQPFDLELETVGFRSDQVEEYVKRAYADETEVASEILAFIQSHWLIEGLLQIPIQLDALCYTWEESPLPENVKTMTALYQAMEVKLWRKDMVQSHRCEANEAKAYWSRAPVERLMGREIDLLDKFAFNGLFNNLVEFHPKHRNTLYQTLPSKGSETDNTLEGLSFLRTSSDGESRIHYFIHLTFEEFFAANYFARCWINKERLEVVSMETASLTHMEPEMFLRREKYNSRYDIMWRFVTGLLFNYDRNSLIRFMQALDSGPSDLLSLAHPRIFMHCFSEIPLPYNDGVLGNLRRNLERDLSRLFSSQKISLISLAGEMEFPETVLYEALNGENEHVRALTCSVLSVRERISPSMFQKLADMATQMHDNNSPSMKFFWGALARHCQVSPGVFGRLMSPKTSSVSMRLGIRDRLQYSSSLSDCILHALVSCLEDCSDSGPEHVARVLQCQPTLPSGIAERIHALLKSERSSVKAYAIISLSRHMLVSKDVFLDILSLESDESQEVREQVAAALGHSPDRPGVLEVLSGLLNDKCPNVRAYAASSLGKRLHGLPQNVLDNLLDRTRDSEGLVGAMALSSWSEHCTDPKAIAQKVFSMLDDEGAARLAALEYLEQHTVLLDDIEQPLIHVLEYGTPSQRYGIAACLSGQDDLDDKTLGTLIDQLALEDRMGLQDTIQDIVGGQKQMSDYVLGRLIGLLREGDSDRTRQYAARMLAQHRSLPEDVLQLLISARKRDLSGSVEYEIALSQQDSLPPAIARQTIPLLDLKWGERSHAAEEVLRKHGFQSHLSYFNQENWVALFEAWFEKSLRNHWSFYRSDDSFILNTPEGSCTFKPPNDLQKGYIEHAIARVQAKLAPPVQEEEPLQPQESEVEETGNKWVHLVLVVHVSFCSLFTAYIAI